MLSPQLLELLCDLWQYAPCACAYLRGPSPLQRTTQTAPLQHNAEKPSQRAMSRLMLKSAKRASLIENLRSLRGFGKMRVR